jgi:hypothetical protein
MTRRDDTESMPDERDLRVAAEARELDLALGSTLRKDTDVARTEAALRAAFAPPRAAGRRAYLSLRRSRLVLAAVTLVSLALGVALWRSDVESLDPWQRSDRLGAVIERVEPLDAPVAEFARFAWRMPTGSQDATSVEVSAVDGTLVAASPRSLATTWTPSDTSDWPSTIVWRVRAFDSSGVESVSTSWSASRSR